MCRESDNAGKIKEIHIFEMQSIAVGIENSAVRKGSWSTCFENAENVKVRLDSWICERPYLKLVKAGLLWYFLYARRRAKRIIHVLHN